MTGNMLVFYGITFFMLTRKCVRDLSNTSNKGVIGLREVPLKIKINTKAFLSIAQALCAFWHFVGKLLLKYSHV